MPRFSPPRAMTAPEAIETIVYLAGGNLVGTRRPHATTYRFANTTVADHCKAVLDALLRPGSTGEVCHTGLLMVDLDGAR